MVDDMKKLKRMPTPEVMVKKFNKGVDYFRKTRPDAPVSLTSTYLDIRAARAAYRIREIMNNYPIGNLAGDDFTHPSKWDEHTLLMFVGAIMREYGTDIPD